jgi:hypothetical protein
MARKPAKGSNQYKTRLQTVVESAVTPDLMAQAAQESTVKGQRAATMAALAQDPKLADTWVTIMGQLLVEGSAGAQCEIVASPDCPPAVIALLVQKRSPYIHTAAAGNPKCPPEVLEYIWHQDWANMEPPQAVLKHRRCPPAVLELAAEHRTPALRRLAARHHRCPPYVLVHLPRDRDEEVRNAAARNPHCPEEYRALAQATT